MKKIILGLGTIATIASPVVLAVSCGNGGGQEGTTQLHSVHNDNGIKIFFTDEKQISSIEVSGTYYRDVTELMKDVTTLVNENELQIPEDKNLIEFVTTVEDDALEALVEQEVADLNIKLIILTGLTSLPNTMPNVGDTLQLSVSGTTITKRWSQDVDNHFKNANDNAAKAEIVINLFATNGITRNAVITAAPFLNNYAAVDDHILNYTAADAFNCISITPTGEISVTQNLQNVVVSVNKTTGISVGEDITITLTANTGYHFTEGMIRTIHFAFQNTAQISETEEHRVETEARRIVGMTIGSSTALKTQLSEGMSINQTTATSLGLGQLDETNFEYQLVDISYDTHPNILFNNPGDGLVGVGVLAASNQHNVGSPASTGQIDPSIPDALSFKVKVISKIDSSVFATTTTPQHVTLASKPAITEEMIAAELKKLFYTTGSIANGGYFDYLVHDSSTDNVGDLMNTSDARIVSEINGNNATIYFAFPSEFGTASQTLLDSIQAKVNTYRGQQNSVRPSATGNEGVGGGAHWSFPRAANWNSRVNDDVDFTFSINNRPLGWTISESDDNSNDSRIVITFTTQKIGAFENGWWDNGVADAGMTQNGPIMYTYTELLKPN